MLLRPPKYKEIDTLRKFPPKDWNFDIDLFTRLHWENSYFNPIVADINNELAAVAFGVKNGDVAWLGGIIVLNKFRKQGIGRAITLHLIKLLKDKGSKSLVLIATEMGRPLYENIGFRTSSYYTFLEGKKISPPKENIRKAVPSDIEQIYYLDFLATGEKRQAFLEKYMKNAWVYEKNEIQGFYLPNFDQGLVIAKNDNAGTSLLQLKHSTKKTTAVLPIENKSAIRFLKEYGFHETKKVPRMYLGKEAKWQPSMIYARAAGYCG